MEAINHEEIHYNTLSEHIVVWIKWPTFVDDIFSCFVMKEKCFIIIRMSLNFFHKISNEEVFDKAMY